MENGLPASYVSIWDVRDRRTDDDVPHSFFFSFYLLVVLDLVFSAAAVRVGRLPPHQRYALLFDLLRPELTY